MTSLLEDRVVLVTGGSMGLGRATAQALARAGACVVIADVQADPGRDAVEAIGRAGGQACFMATDVRDPAQIERTLAYVVRRFGRLDGAFNNAGIRESGTAAVADLEASTWDRVMDVNLRGLWLCMKQEIALMLKTGGGVIVNPSAAAGPRGGRWGGAAGAASQYGVLGLTRAAALQYADRNIHVRALCTATGRPAFAAARAGDLTAVADAVVGLLLEATASNTGHEAAIDGGLLTP